MNTPLNKALAAQVHAEFAHYFLGRHIHAGKDIDAWLSADYATPDWQSTRKLGQGDYAIIAADGATLLANIAMPASPPDNVRVMNDAALGGLPRSTHIARLMFNHEHDQVLLLKFGQEPMRRSDMRISPQPRDWLYESVAGKPTNEYDIALFRRIDAEIRDIGLDYALVIKAFRLLLFSSISGVLTPQEQDEAKAFANDAWLGLYRPLRESPADGDQVVGFIQYVTHQKWKRR